MPWASIASVFLLALLGGLHCAAMCGGVVSAFALDRTLPVGGWRRAAAMSSYHLGRISSYVLLGAVAGAASGALLPWREFVFLQRSLYGLAGLVMLWLAWRLWRGQQAWPLLERLLSRLVSPLRSRLGLLARSARWWARLAVGVVWGLVPCGMVYGALALALLAGSPLWGGLLMLVFGLGTVPNLLFADWLFARAQQFGGESWRRAGALIIAAFGLWTWHRLIWESERIAVSLFCAVP